MNFLRLFLFFTAFASCLFFCAQDVNGLSDQLILLQENISNKSFVKSWKKNKKSWENSCKSAQTNNELINLANKLITVYNSSANGSLFKIPDIKFDAVCNALLNLINQFPPSELSFTNSSLEKWKDNMRVLITTEQNRLLEIEKAEELEKSKSRVLLADSLIDLFIENYASVFDGANKGSFSELISTSSQASLYKVNLDFGSIANCSVVIDEDGVYELILVYSTSSDEQLADLIMEKCYKYISSHLKEGFKESKMFDGNYQTNFIKVFDFQGQKFADTAKHPKIQLGVKKESFEVYFIVTEPLFRR